VTTPSRWSTIERLYHAAVERDATERNAFLTEACDGDDALRREVESLLAHERTADGLFATPALEVAAKTLGDDTGDTLVGRSFGNYQVVSALGAGGMGEVYRAYDATLARDVAIKVLPVPFTADSDRLARFEQEARMLAALNHPHIGAIYGVEHENGVRGLVLELVEGATLAERIASGPLPVPEALGIARQIADALDAAHEKGIIHRDLKPANIKITPDGIVKVLDFGLAKIVGADPVDGVDASAPTAATREGTALGTPGYMSPEQTRGHMVDKRTDIWAFGCVVYEMLTGGAPFARQSGSDTLAAVLERPPDWMALPADTPSPVRHLLERCLDKNPKQRLRDIGDAWVEIDRALEMPAEAASTAARWPSTSAWLAVGAIAVVMAISGIFWMARPAQRTTAADHRVSRFTVALPPDQEIWPGFNSDVALSPDGSQLVFTTLPGPIFIRRLNSLETRPLESSDGYYSAGATFSPDGKSISFIRGNAIKSSKRPFQRAALSGGAPVTLTEYDMFHRGDWGADGWIYWTAHYPGGIVRSRDSGGEPEAVTELDVRQGDRSHRFATLLPGGQALIYTVGFDGITTYDDARIDLWDLRTRQHRTLITGGTSPAYSPSGHIVYARAGKLFAVPFDVGTRQVTGVPFEAVDGVLESGNTGAAYYSLSHRGDLAYVPGPAADGHRTLVWVDRAGHAETLPLPPASYLYPRLSPDGRYLAVEIEGPNHDVYLYDFSTGVLSKVTTDGLSHNPVWSPDGKRFAFRSWQAGGMTMWWMPADRSAAAVRLDPRGTRQSPSSFSPDGKFLAFDQNDTDTASSDAWVLPLGGGASQPIARSRFQEGSPKFSPDGRWVAYASNESGQSQIYVQPFPGPGPKVQISNDGGVDPIWRRSGREIYYRYADKMMMATIVTAPQLRASAPKPLWEGIYASGSGSSCGMPGVTASDYDVTPDGRRFLMVRDDDTAVGASHIVVVLNWADELKNMSATGLAVASARASAAR
jgi:eukaryotic-like serine/threonine-protein kinase